MQIFTEMCRRKVTGMPDSRSTSGQTEKIQLSLKSYNQLNFSGLNSAYSCSQILQTLFQGTASYKTAKF